MALKFTRIKLLIAKILYFFVKLFYRSDIGSPVNPYQLEDTLKFPIFSTFLY